MNDNAVPQKLSPKISCSDRKDIDVTSISYTPSGHIYKQKPTF